MQLFPPDAQPATLYPNTGNEAAGSSHAALTTCEYVLSSVDMQKLRSNSATPSNSPIRQGSIIFSCRCVTTDPQPLNSC